jgi:5-(carboxyamino)imidazole ribonucleotide synthase
MAFEPLRPGAVIGILGGGQLGRMLALAAPRLGFRCHIYAPPGDNPAFDVSCAHTAAAYEDEAALARFASGVSVVTYEFENVPSATCAALERLVTVAPGREALRVAQDRLEEKTFLSRLGVPVAPFTSVAGVQDIEEAASRIGLPAVLKTRRFGYDGKGQAKIVSRSGCAEAWSAIGKAPAVLEAFVPFDAELSVIAARGRDGSFVPFDIPENWHENHILRQSRVPARVAPETVGWAGDIARGIADGLGYVGVLAVELFLLRRSGREELLVNEIAPRVHNSGHWTLDACHVSQFEQHIRAIAGWPLGDPSRHSDSIMQNLLGLEVDDWERLAKEPQTAVHIYGKAEARPGRKMGHFTRLHPLGAIAGKGK